MLLFSQQVTFSRHPHKSTKITSSELGGVTIYQMRKQQWFALRDWSVLVGNEMCGTGKLAGLKEYLKYTQLYFKVSNADLVYCT